MSTAFPRGAGHWIERHHASADRPASLLIRNDRPLNRATGREVSPYLGPKIHRGNGLNHRFRAPTGHPRPHSLLLQICSGAPTEMASGVIVVVRVVLVGRVTRVSIGLRLAAQRLPLVE